MIEINHIAQSCEQLKLTGILQSYQSIATECCKTQASYTEYLSLLLQQEILMRESRSQATILQLAKLPVLKNLQQFDFSASAVNEMEIQELANLQFIANKENIILHKLTRTDKTSCCPRKITSEISDNWHQLRYHIDHHYRNRNTQKYHNFFGAIAKLVMPRIANPTCVGSSPTSSSISNFHISYFIYC